MELSDAGRADVERIDHVAITVPDFDATVAMLSDALGLRCARIGRLGRDRSRRIAMISDGTGFKLEIIEATDDGRAPGEAPQFAVLDHVAVRVHDVDACHDRLVGEGFTERFPPRRLDPADARTALLTEPNGLDIQLIRYEPTSPDL